MSTFILGVLLCCAFVLITLILYFVDKSMTIQYSESWGYANFNTFLKEFNKREWIYDETFPNSLFGEKSNETQLHAGIMMFDNKGMVLDYISYIRFLLWSFINKRKISNKKFSKDLWKS